MHNNTKAEGDAKRPCPAYEQKIGCWELDWKTMYASLPEDQKKMMGEWMKDNCPKCPVYGNHQSEIDTKISAIT